MKVVEELPKPVSRFSQIAEGDVFCPADRAESYYMKINGAWPNGGQGTPPNAVLIGYSDEDEEELGTGNLLHFNANAKVIWYPRTRLILGLANRAPTSRGRARRLRDDDDEELPRRKRRPTGDDEPETEVNDEEER